MEVFVCAGGTPQCIVVEMGFFIKKKDCIELDDLTTLKFSSVTPCERPGKTSTERTRTVQGDEGGLYSVAAGGV